MLEWYLTIDDPLVLQDEHENMMTGTRHAAEHGMDAAWRLPAALAQPLRLRHCLTDTAELHTLAATAAERAGRHVRPPSPTTTSAPSWSTWAAVSGGRRRRARISPRRCASAPASATAGASPKSTGISARPSPTRATPPPTTIWPPQLFEELGVITPGR
ncbi:hypothetical protein ACIBO2_24810 [Nonomuraea sp. NPDC050022]|uniref:hypothetical protein n=1 Tax=Nonomuraea sp. NPDC050022 TaxID=3364358 RepID=UPI0037A4EDC2